MRSSSIGSGGEVDMATDPSAATMQRTPRPRFAASAAYYDHVARGYDIVAGAYDDVEGKNEISERVRRLSLESALKVFRPGDRILELGCGTGRDAVFLARNGIRVTATDLSPAMVTAARQRVNAEGLRDLVSVECLGAAMAAAAGGPYDGAYSNGAVLNLEPDLERVAKGLADSLAPGAFAVLTAANRVSLFELLLYPTVLRPRKAFRKLGRDVPIPVSREGTGKGYVVATRFLTPREFLSRFESAFDLAFQRGIQVLTPPWNLVDMHHRFRLALDPFEKLEDHVGSAPGLRSLGAIYLVGLRRR